MTLREARRELVTLFGRNADIVRRSDLVAMRRHVCVLRNVVSKQLTILGSGRTAEQALQQARSYAGKTLLEKLEIA